MNKRFLVPGLIFIILSIIFFYIHVSMSNDVYTKSVVLLKAGESVYIPLRYSTLLFEYKDNISKPILLKLINSEIINYTYQNDTYYLYIRTFYNSSIFLINNYTSPVLIGFVEINEDPIILLYFVSFILFLILVAIGVILVSLSFILKS